MRRFYTNLSTKAIIFTVPGTGRCGGRTSARAVMESADIMVIMSEFRKRTTVLLRFT